jgi:hypothetical protein
MSSGTSSASTQFPSHHPDHKPNPLLVRFLSSRLQTGDHVRNQLVTRGLHHLFATIAQRLADVQISASLVDSQFGIAFVFDIFNAVLLETLEETGTVAAWWAAESPAASGVLSFVSVVESASGGSVWAVWGLVGKLETCQQRISADAFFHLRLNAIVQTHHALHKCTRFWSLDISWWLREIGFLTTQLFKTSFERRLHFLLRAVLHGVQLARAILGSGHSHANE